MAEREIGDQMSNFMRDKVREVKADGLSGNVKVLSRRALMDIVDQLIKAYGGLEHQDLISKIAHSELEKKQLENQMAALSGKLEVFERQGGDLRQENAEMLAKVKSAEARMPMLEEQNAVLKKTVDGLEATAENLKAKLAAAEEAASALCVQTDAQIASLKARVAELEPMISSAQAMRADVERRLKDKDDYISDLQGKVDDALSSKEKALSDMREKIARLEKALQQSDSRKRILELENEVTELKSSLAALEQGLEFVDTGVLPDFDAAGLEIKEIDDVISKFPPENTDAEPLRVACASIRAVLERDRGDWPGLLELMYGEKGSISVACELAKISVRQEALRSQARTLRAAAALL